jgi:phosphate transport system permease protein
LSRSSLDRVVRGLTRASAALAAGLVVLIFGFLVLESWPALQRIGPTRFLTDASWHPRSGQYQLGALLVGSAAATLGAMLIAAPLGVGAAIHLHAFATPRRAGWYRRLVELMAGIPSVIYGLWGLVVLVPLLARFGGSGQSLLAAALVLALMILPTVVLTADAALGAVPAAWLRGGAALGLGRWAIARRIALPAARGGIGAGLLLAAGRAVGETMAVLMVAGNVVELPRSLLDPIRTITANIALEMGYATRDHRAVLFVSGLFLLAAVSALVVVAARFEGTADP